ncbi:MAG: hypothetical protein AB4911_23725 [Oscillochloridaceae bacterium umkhey_bin13]
MQPGFNIAEAFNYYNRHINRQDRFMLLREHGFAITGSIHPVDWELFGSILTGESGKPGYGSDLSHYEIKSASEKGSFEYQYHLNAGQKKLREDMEVDHLFISYAKDYAEVTVRLVTGDKLLPIFQKWEPSLIMNYDAANPRQRFRRSIAYGTVVQLGTVIMQIKDHILVYPI